MPGWCQSTWLWGHRAAGSASPGMPSAAQRSAPRPIAPQSSQQQQFRQSPIERMYRHFWQRKGDVFHLLLNMALVLDDRCVQCEGGEGKGDGRGGHLGGREMFATVTVCKRLPDVGFTECGPRRTSGACSCSSRWCTTSRVRCCGWRG